MQTVTASLSNALAWMQTAWPPWFAGLLILAVVASLLLFLHSAVFAVLGLVLRGRLAVFGETLLTRVKAPTRLGLVVIGLGLALQALPSRAGLFALIQWALLFGFVIAVGWTAIAVVNTAADLYLRRVPENSEDSALTRKHLTQVRLLRRITVIVIGFLTFAAVLMTIPSVRQYGVSLFASAGVAGLAVGLAARPLLSNLIAGVQIAVAQPIRLGDGIFIEGEFGNVEEIQTTYVAHRDRILDRGLRGARGGSSRAVPRHREGFAPMGRSGGSASGHRREREGHAAQGHHERSVGLGQLGAALRGPREADRLAPRSLSARAPQQRA
jgi:small-conductance mechanosensitive channel